MDKEIWKDIENFEGEYQVSNLGRVRSLGGWRGCVKKRKRVLISHKKRDGYLTVNLCGTTHKKKNALLHRLVANAFLPNPNKKKEVNHIDGNKTNNAVDNLEWSTRSENIKHAYETGLEKKQYGTKSHRAKFTISDIAYIRSHYIPRDKEYGARALSRKYGVSRTTIERVLRKETYPNE